MKELDLGSAFAGIKPESVSAGTDEYYKAPFYRDLRSCTACTCRPEARQVVPGVGPRNAEILWAGRNPGGEEDRDGIPFIGRGGTELTKMCEAIGVDRAKCGVINTVKCHTARDRPPSKKEVETCVNLWLGKELDWFHNTKVIFPLGNQAVQVFYPPATSTAKREGYWVTIKYGDRILNVCPLNHPGYLLRQRRYQIAMYEAVLPTVKNYMLEHLRDIYERSRLEK